MPVYYDVPMHGQRNIEKCKERLLQDVAVWTDKLSALSSTRIEITEELTSIINQNFKSLEK
jgi:hypothetical protein